MICRQCGTEIADKAIVCYRCGTSTTDPVRRPAVVGPRRGRAFPVVGLALLALLSVYLGQAGHTILPAGKGYGLAAGVAITVAIILLVVRIIRRR